MPVIILIAILLTIVLCELLILYNYTNINNRVRVIMCLSFDLLQYCLCEVSSNYTPLQQQSLMRKSFYYTFLFYCNHSFIFLLLFLFYLYFTLSGVYYFSAILWHIHIHRTHTKLQIHSLLYFQFKPFSFNWYSSNLLLPICLSCFFT